MLSKNLKRFSGRPERIALCCSTALAFSVIFPKDVSFQDVVQFADKQLDDDRWLASIVDAPSPFVHDPALRSKIEPIILDDDGALISDNAIAAKGDLKAYAFARTPRIAYLLSQKTVVNRAEKGDLPIQRSDRHSGILKTRSLFANTVLFSAPDGSLWPASTLSNPNATTQVAAKKTKAVTRQAQAKTQPKGNNEPLVLLPEAALAAIEAKANERVNVEIDETITASIGNIATAQIGYANRGDDPRTIFEAVLARGNGKAELPDAPNGDSVSINQVKEVIDTPLAAGLDDARGYPNPRLKPEVVARLDPSARKSNKKQHFWAKFKLPGSVHKKTEQRCLAAGIYFEARGEVEKGQAAVAQVILNRVKAPSYPNTICGVVYQNKHWRNRCQFSFACDGIYDRVRDKKAWDRAVRIARDVSKGKIYLDKVADSTHYHATYVKPRWRLGMKVVDRIGIHIFYRTKKGGWS